MYSGFYHTQVTDQEKWGTAPKTPETPGSLKD